MRRIRSFTLVLVAALVACALTPAAATAISRAEIVARGKVWLRSVRVDPKTGARSTGVLYSQGRWALENGSLTPTITVGYRTDCSGFASMCWNLRDSAGRPYSTSTYDMGRNQSSLFKLAPLSKAELLPGDLMLKSTVWYRGSGGGHAIIFAGWANSAKTYYYALEQTGPKTKLSKRPYGQTGYRAFRFNGVDGFNRTRVTYGSALTGTGLAKKRWTEGGVQREATATAGVVDLVLCGSDGAQTALTSAVPVGVNGLFSISCVPTQSGSYAVRYREKSTSSVSNVLYTASITVAPYVSGVGGNGSKLRRRKTYGFYGYVNPQASAGMRVYKYSARRHRYVYLRTVRTAVAIAKGSRGYRLTASWRPTSAGKYLLYWQTAAPSGMSSAASGSRYVTVK